MRPIIILLIIVIVSISIRIDLTSGTIPKYNNHPENNETTSEQEVPVDISELTTPDFQKVMVESGQTVYGITQQLHEAEGFTKSIQEVLEDFEALNPNIAAHELFAGEIYKFPIYQSNFE